MKKIAVVNFNGLNANTPNTTKKYAYYTSMADLKKGDVVAVQSMETLSLANFLEYKEIEEVQYKPTKWIVSKVDTGFHEELKKKEERRKEIAKKIERRYKDFDDLDKSRLIACFDPNMAEIFREYDELMGAEEAYDVEMKIKELAMKTLF